MVEIAEVMAEVEDEGEVAATAYLEKKTPNPVKTRAQ